MNIYIAELFILSILCPSIIRISGVHLHNNHYDWQDDKASANREKLTKVGKLIHSPGK